MNLLNFTRLAMFLAATSSVLSLPHSPLEVKESVFVPQGFVKRSVAPDSTPINLRIALSHRGIEDLKATLSETSNPDSPLYGKHLSQEEVDQHLAPKESDSQLVKKWLESHGFSGNEIQKRSTAGDWLEIRTSVGQASKMLNAEFGVYSLEEEESKMLVRTTEYSLPRDLHSAIDLVDVTYFSKNRAMRAPYSNLKALDKDYQTPNIVQPDVAGANGAPASCQDSATTYACISALYQTADYVPTNRSSNNVAITGYLGQHYSYSDLQNLEKKQKPKAVGYNPKVVLLNNGTNAQDMQGVEADLDVDTVTALTYPVDSTFFSTGGEPPFIPDLNEATNGNEPYSEFFTYQLGLKTPSAVITTSYGDDEQTVPIAYARKVCDQIMALGARGTSVIFASGDYGVGKSGTCKSNDGKNTTMFIPSFPASCPYATTVGGTEKYAPERAVSAALGGFYGGGGYSNYFEPLDFMKSAQQAYIKSIGNLNDGLYNKSGRGYPDVSAQSSNYLIETRGGPNTVGGTSAACPTFASVVALLNDYRLSKGQSTLGFLNPLIYTKLGGSPGLFDVTTGSNNGCNTKGFPAKSGWDPASGYGTPRFTELQKLV